MCVCVYVGVSKVGKPITLDLLSITESMHLRGASIAVTDLCNIMQLTIETCHRYQEYLSVGQYSCIEVGAYIGD